MNFQTLVASIQQTHKALETRAVVAVNQSLVLRNWLMGCYIVEFEQHGKDYAEYGERLLYRLSEELGRSGMKGVSYTNLTLYRKFYLTYPQFAGLAAQVPELDKGEKFFMGILQALPEEFISKTLPPELLSSKLSFTHFVELLKVEDAMSRLFYEMECMKGNWTYRQLQRQIGSLLYERTGLSKNKEALIALAQGQPTPLTFADLLREPYMFEFTGLKTADVFREEDLEKALLDHLQDFLLELGTGFCLEARQKSFLIDNRRYKVDLLFYHRILKCHVVIDLKTGQFEHEDAGQDLSRLFGMNFYLNYHRDNEMQEGDSPPVGIILCTYKNEVVVRYATGSLDNRLFVSKYMLQLPGEELLRQFLLDEKKRLGGI